MRVVIAAVGRLKTGPEKELVTRYGDRIVKTGRPIGVSGLDQIEIPESRASQADQRKREEEQALFAKIPDNSYIIAFDERAKSATSPEFAQDFRTLLDEGIGHCTFVIGGPDGLSESVRARVNRTLSFGRLTLPHQIVRILVMEQIYRATTLLTNHPYHRE